MFLESSNVFCELEVIFKVQYWTIFSTYILDSGIQDYIEYKIKVDKWTFSRIYNTNNTNGQVATQSNIKWGILKTRQFNIMVVWLFSGFGFKGRKDSYFLGMAFKWRKHFVQQIWLKDGKIVFV